MAGASAAVAGLVFAGLKPEDDPLRAVAHRLAGAEDLLNCYAADRPVDENARGQIARMAIVGSSSLRRLLRRSVQSTQYKEQAGAVVPLAGRLARNIST